MMMKKMENENNECEHESNLIFENWMGENSAMIKLECQKCKSTFSGLMIKDEK